MVQSEGMSLKNPVTPPGIDPGTVRLVALTTRLPQAPRPLELFEFKFNHIWCRKFWAFMAVCCYEGAYVGARASRRCKLYCQLFENLDGLHLQDKESTP